MTDLQRCQQAATAPACPEKATLSLALAIIHQTEREARHD